MMLTSFIIFNSFLVNVFANTLLTDQLCQKYYMNPSGNCDNLRDAIVSRDYTLPTLELGNKDDPAILMFHGWPDTAAEWAMQMEEYCLFGNYFCVVPSWIDYHPDVPPANENMHFWIKQIEAWRAVVTDAGISNITLFIHDFGSLLGYQFVYLYPDIVNKVISFDVGNTVSGLGGAPLGVDFIPYLMEYQQFNILSYLTKNDTLMSENMNTTLARICPCTDCRIAPNSTGWGWRTGWPYYSFVRNDTTWPSLLSPNVPIDQYEFSFTPSWPSNIPLLFLYGACEIDLFPSIAWMHQGYCIPRSFYFFDPSFLDWIDTQSGSYHIKVEEGGHWMHMSQYSMVNKYINDFLNPTPSPTPTPTETSSAIRIGSIFAFLSVIFHVLS